MVVIHGRPERWKNKKEKKQIIYRNGCSRECVCWWACSYYYLGSRLLLPLPLVMRVVPLNRRYLHSVHVSVFGSKYRVKYSGAANHVKLTRALYICAPFAVVLVHCPFACATRVCVWIEFASKTMPCIRDWRGTGVWVCECDCVWVWVSASLGRSNDATLLYPSRLYVFFVLFCSSIRAHNTPSTLWNPLSSSQLFIHDIIFEKDIPSGEIVFVFGTRRWIWIFNWVGAWGTWTRRFLYGQTKAEKKYFNKKKNAKENK